MARKARQRISYVLPLANSPGGHRLGVNSLAVDKNERILYTAGRDGAICSWNVGVELLSTAAALGEFVPRPIPPPSTFRSQLQAHTHWVNDIVLCDSGRAVVSCSSDLTVKLWRPHSANQSADTIGVHSDYVKCLSAPSHSNWVASGGLDRRIKFWDLSGCGENLQIDVGDGGNNPKGSVYSLGTGGGILASGGPESVVRVWDPRSGKPVTKFVGHTDNVRSILVNDQGNMVMTASSDTTIKLWSLTAGRCLHTLSMHNDSVWSLYSSHPSLEVFHSSDRSGLVAKTDVRGVAEMEEGICVAVCQERDGINKVVASGDYLWTATPSSSINRWMDVDTDTDFGADYRRPRVASSATTRPRASTTSNTTSPASSSPGLSAKRSGIPFHSLLRLTSSSAFHPTVRDPDTVTIYSVASVRQASIPEPLREGDPGIVLPANEFPDETIEGQRGLLKHFLLNDRRRVLTVDTAGEVVMWDLLKCVPIRFFGARHLEDVAAEINTTHSIANWCQVDTRTGRLACVLEENYCFDAEIYADEAEIEEQLDFRDDQRINLGKWVLRYLFSNLIDEEIRRDQEYRKTPGSQRRDRFRNESAVTHIQIPPPTLTTTDPAGGMATPLKPSNGGYSLFPQTPNLGIGIATPVGLNNLNTHFTPWEDNQARTSIDRQSGDYFTAGGNSNGARKSGDYFTPGGNPNGARKSVEASDDGRGTPMPDKDKEEKDSSLFGKWRPFGTKKLGRSTSTDMGGLKTVPHAAEDKAGERTAAGESAEQPDQLDETLAGVIRNIRKTYDALDRDDSSVPPNCLITPSLPSETPVLKLPKNTAIIVQEDKPDSGGVADLYRGTVGCVGRDADLLEKVAPAWLGELILLNRIPIKDTIKVSFVLVPWDDSLPFLPSESGSEGKHSRLNANRMLRAKKIMAYVAEHLQPPFLSQSYVPATREGEEPPKVEEWLELLSHDQVIPATMTLATMRSYVWKMSGDVMIHYRRKRAPPPTTTTTTGEGDDDDEEKEETVVLKEHFELVEDEQEHLLANPSPIESKRSSNTANTVGSNGKNPVGGNTSRVQNLIY